MQGRSDAAVATRLLSDPGRIPVLSRDEVFAALDTGPSGLSETDAAERLARVGPNRIEEVPGPSWVRRLLSQFTHLFALLLWAGSVLALVSGQPGIAVAIVAVIVLNGVFGFLQENRAERAVAALKRLLPAAAAVRRGGQQRRIPAEELVPGDVLVLEEGDKVSADARLVDAADLRSDESSLTGEAVPVHKVAEPEPGPPKTAIQAHNVVFAGSTIISGDATAVVVATGMHTEFGRIAQLTQAVRQEPSPLQVEVGRVAQRVALLSVAMGVGFFLIGYLVAGLTLRNGAIFAIGIVLANVPEGLLPTMTLALAMGVQRMAARKAIVKRLSSVETLGSCTVICTDKTGTITKNQMTVKEVWAVGTPRHGVGSGLRAGRGLPDRRAPRDEGRAGRLPSGPSDRPPVQLGQADRSAERRTKAGERSGIRRKGPFWWPPPRRGSTASSTFGFGPSCGSWPSSPSANACPPSTARSRRRASWSRT